MGFKEDFEEFLDESEGFAENAILLCNDLEINIRIIITANCNSDYFNDGPEVLGRQITMETSADYMEDACIGDKIIINDQHYIIQSIKDDNTGWLVCDLEKA